MMPRASRSFRIRSASAKLRASRAARRASISRSISVDRHRRLLVLLLAAATARRAPDRTLRTSARTAAASPAPSSPASIAEFSARTRSNITPMPAAVFRSAAMCPRNAVARLREPRRDLIVLRPGGQRVEPRQEIGQPLERLLGLRHRGPRELQLLAVVHAEIQVAQRRRPVALARRCRRG